MRVNDSLEPEFEEPVNLFDVLFYIHLVLIVYVQIVCDKHALNATEE